MDTRPRHLVLAIYFCAMVSLRTSSACDLGFERANNRSCIDTNECAGGKTVWGALCGSHTECYNTYGSYYCACKKGYFTPSGKTNFTTITHCQENNECYQKPRLCGPNTICHNTVGSFYCLCKKGFITSSGLANFTDVNTGCLEINECQSNPCGPNARCINIAGSFNCTCGKGFVSNTGETIFKDKTKTQCQDINECEAAPCGSNAECTNKFGSFDCTCDEGFVSTTGSRTFTDKTQTQCRDINECEANPCGSNATCTNTFGDFYCTCNSGFQSSTGESTFTDKTVTQCRDTNECAGGKATVEALCGSHTECYNTLGSYYCACKKGYLTPSGKTNFTTNTNCQELKDLHPESSSLQDIDSFASQSFKVISMLHKGNSEQTHKLISQFFEVMENYTIAAARKLLHNETKNFSSNSFDIIIQAIRNNTIPKNERAMLATAKSSLDIGWNSVAGKESFDVAAVALISYKQLDSLMEPNLLGNNNVETKLGLISEVVTATVTNKDRKNLTDPVIITFENKKYYNQTAKCVYWETAASAWSARGCTVNKSSPTHTVCSCTHLSSFAVLMALHEIKGIHAYNQGVITIVGIILSLVCLFISIITFILCRAIKSIRTTIHTHLCISLFLAELLFLVGIARTENKIGCAVVAGFLHYLFLACFAWMLLEGVQLYFMVVKVFNAKSLRPKYMYMFGYGFPLIVVAISAAAYSQGYGTNKLCWLDLKSGFIWAFLAPVCIIIVVNAGFFIVTVWKLVNKFSSLNPDMDQLKKVRAFTFTAIAQLCLLGCTWIVGIMHFQDGTIFMSYIFTIINSMQGAFIFILHCLFNKQVRDEYAKVFFAVCHMKKASKYSEFSSSSTQGLKNTHETGM